MTAQNPQQRQYLDRANGLASRAQGHQWLVEEDDGGTHIIAIRGNDPLAESEAICTIHPKASADERDLLRLALFHVQFLVEQRSRFVSAYRELEARLNERREQQRQGLKSGDFAANCAIILAEPVFWEFLEKKHLNRPVYNKEQADGAIKELLNFTSKKQLNSDAAIQARYFTLREQFQTYLSEER